MSLDNLLLHRPNAGHLAIIISSGLFNYYENTTKYYKASFLNKTLQNNVILKQLFVKKF